MYIIHNKNYSHKIAGAYGLCDDFSPVPCGFPGVCALLFCLDYRRLEEAQCASTQTYTSESEAVIRPRRTQNET